MRVTPSELRLLQSAARESAVVTGDGSVLLVLRCLPPSLNEWGHWTPWERAAEAQFLRDVVTTLARPLGRSPLPRARVWTAYWFPTSRRRDRPNVSHWKGMHDALVRARLIVDDNAQAISTPEPMLEVDPRAPRSVIVIEPWDGDIDNAGRRPRALLCVLSARAVAAPGDDPAGGVPGPA